MDPSVAQDLNRVADYLADGSPELPQASVLVLMACALPYTLVAAAMALREGAVERLVVSGGVGHSTEPLRQMVRDHDIWHDIPVDGRAEAEIAGDVLVRHLGVDPRQLVLEATSTNCGSNAVETRRVLGPDGVPSARLVVFQDPPMQRRSMASFRRAFSGTGTVILGWAPFVPQVQDSEEELSWLHEPDGGLWPMPRFLELVLGEIPRLHDTVAGYGPQGRGFIESIQVPREVLAAHERLTSIFGALSR